MFLNKGLTQVHSQKRPRLHFGETFALMQLNLETCIYSIQKGLTNWNFSFHNINNHLQFFSWVWFFCCYSLGLRGRSCVMLRYVISRVKHDIAGCCGEVVPEEEKACWFLQQSETFSCHCGLLTVTLRWGCLVFGICLVNSCFILKVTLLSFQITCPSSRVPGLTSSLIPDCLHLCFPPSCV